MDGHQPKAQEEVPHCPARLAERRYAPKFTFFHMWRSENCETDFLQDRLTRETTQPEFSELPFRFAEIAKVLLDVSVKFPLYSILF